MPVHSLRRIPPAIRPSLAPRGRHAAGPAAALAALLLAAPAGALDIGIGIGGDSGLNVGVGIGGGGIGVDVGLGGDGGVNVGAGVGGDGVNADVGVGGEGGLNVDASLDQDGLGLNASLGGAGGGGQGPGDGSGTPPPGSGEVPVAPGLPGTLEQPSAAQLDAARRARCRQGGNSSTYNGFVAFDPQGRALGVVHGATLSPQLAFQSLVLATIPQGGIGTTCVEIRTADVALGNGAMRLPVSWSRLYDALPR